MTSSPKTTDGDLTPDKVHLGPSFDQHITEVPDELAKLAQRQLTNSPPPTESGLELVSSSAGGQNDKGGSGPGNDPVADSLRNDQLSQQQPQPTTIVRPTVKKKCLAVVEVEQKNKSTICLKYAFFVTETETFPASGDEHCNPTVEHMMRTLLPKHLRLSMEQLTKKFGLQLQRLDNEFEPAEFIDIDPREWGSERVKDRGEYKVLLHRKPCVNKGILNILLLGETCVGKSTLINSVVNYLKHPTFDEAIQADKIEWVIPAKFCTEEYDDDGDLVKREVQLGEENEDERLEFGKLHTKRPTAYTMHSKGGQKIRLIDTPGIGDKDGGVEEDNKNFQKTLNFISTLPELHAICILLQSNCACITAQSKYCLNGLFSHLHKNAAENIFFMFTSARGANYKMGNTCELLIEVLDEAKNVSIPLNRDIIYCLDNEALEHLCLIKKANVRYSEENMADFSKSWTRADHEVQRLFKYVSTLKPHRTRETVSLNIARKTIVDLAPALVRISEDIQNNLIRIKQQEKAIIADKRDTLSTLESCRLQMLHERALIYSKAVSFSSFLKTWALKPYNDSAEAYIQLSIRNAEQFVAESNGEVNWKLQVEKFEGLKDTGPKVINAADGTEFFEELCKLPIFGESIKQMYEVQQKKRKDNQETGTEADIEFMPEPSNNRKSSRDEANDAQMASGSAAFRQQPPTTTFDTFCRKLPLVGPVYRRIRPSLAQPPQLQQQQQKFKWFQRWMDHP